MRVAAPRPDPSERQPVSAGRGPGLEGVRRAAPPPRSSCGASAGPERARRACRGTGLGAACRRAGSGTGRDGTGRAVRGAEPEGTSTPAPARRSRTARCSPAAADERASSPRGAARPEPAGTSPPTAPLPPARRATRRQLPPAGRRGAERQRTAGLASDRAARNRPPRGLRRAAGIPTAWCGAGGEPAARAPGCSGEPGGTSQPELLRRASTAPGVARLHAACHTMTKKVGCFVLCCIPCRDCTEKQVCLESSLNVRIPRRKATASALCAARPGAEKLISAVSCILALVGSWNHAALKKCKKTTLPTLLSADIIPLLLVCLQSAHTEAFTWSLLMQMGHGL